MDELGCAFSAYRSRVYAAGFRGTPTVGDFDVSPCAMRRWFTSTTRSGAIGGATGSITRTTWFTSTPTGLGASIDAPACDARRSGRGARAPVCSTPRGRSECSTRSSRARCSGPTRAASCSTRSGTLHRSSTRTSFPRTSWRNSLLALSSRPATHRSFGRRRRPLPLRLRFRERTGSRGRARPARRRDEWHHLVTTNRDAILAHVRDGVQPSRIHRPFGVDVRVRGIGSIYWHMVAKLLVAVQESIVDAVEEGASGYRAPARRGLLAGPLRARVRTRPPPSSAPFRPTPTPTRPPTPAPSNRA